MTSLYHESRSKRALFGSIHDHFNMENHECVRTAMLNKVVCVWHDGYMRDVPLSTARLSQRESSRDEFPMCKPHLEPGPSPHATVTRLLTNYQTPADAAHTIISSSLPCHPYLHLSFDQVERLALGMTVSNMSSCCYAFLICVSRRQPHRASKP